MFFFFFFWHLKPGCSSELYGSGVEFTEAQLIQIKVIYCLVLLINWLCLYVFATTSLWQVTKWSWHHCADFLGLGDFTDWQLNTEFNILFSSSCNCFFSFSPFLLCLVRLPVDLIISFLHLQLIDFDYQQGLATSP